MNKTEELTAKRRAAAIAREIRQREYSRVYYHTIIGPRNRAATAEHKWRAAEPQKPQETAEICISSREIIAQTKLVAIEECNRRAAEAKRAAEARRVAAIAKKSWEVDEKFRKAFEKNYQKVKEEKINKILRG